MGVWDWGMGGMMAGGLGQHSLQRPFDSRVADPTEVEAWEGVGVLRKSDPGDILESAGIGAGNGGGGGWFEE